ncbi:aspartate racemase [Penicillium mononematosum]|uniref:aspartate racemase n=1 Tax=Penicillium mononematosum TaxID=268346 RepID=UPI002547EB17|nr:aspartate racemase [Penicillium mononematosum]KAJ6185625.1 aspartate racemase [Penicillium mononematosum]
MTRTVGLIGGMSWQTTAVYYEGINNHVRSVLGGIHSANLLIRSVDYADIGRFVTSGNSEGMIEMLSSAGQQLKDGGAQSLVLCANVAHKAVDSLEERTRLPVLHIVDFTGQAILDRGFRKVGLIATRAVMEEEFYKSRLQERYGLEVVVPNKEFRDKVDGYIFNELSKQPIAEHVKAGFEDACTSLVHEHGVDCLALACTELRLVLDASKMIVPAFETTTLHAKGIAEWALQHK